MLHPTLVGSTRSLKHIRRAKFGDSELSCFDDVEKEDRFYEDGQEELAIQAQKPSA